VNSRVVACRVDVVVHDPIAHGERQRGLAPEHTDV
jgi:hypothetical protein